MTILDELTTFASAHGLEAVDLDDSVRDVTDSLASSRVNADVTFDDICDAQDHLYGLGDELAASVNNGGVVEQIRFLLEHLGAADARKELTRIADTAAGNVVRSNRESRPL